jgi:hypothetical protein
MNAYVAAGYLAALLGLGSYTAYVLGRERKAVRQLRAVRRASHD